MLRLRVSQEEDWPVQRPRDEMARWLGAVLSADVRGLPWNGFVLASGAGGRSVDAERAGVVGEPGAAEAEARRIRLRGGWLWIA